MAQANKILIEGITKKAIAAVLFISLLAGCDPAWHYIVRNPGVTQNSRQRYTVTATQGLETTVYCSLFAAGLTVEIEIVNSGSSPLSVDPKLLRVTDSKGAELSKNFVIADISKNDDIVILSNDHRCKLSAYFRVNPFWGPFGLFKNPDLEHLTISMDGLTRGEKQIPLQILLERYQ
jgi:hypothetical protein